MPPFRFRSGRGVGVRARSTRSGAVPLAVQSLPFTDTFTRADGSLGAPWRDMNSVHPNQQDRVGIRSNTACDVEHQNDNYGGTTVTSGWRGGAFVQTGASDNIEVTCNIQAGAAAGMVSGGPMVHYVSGAEDLGLSCWYNPVYRLLELGPIVRTPENFRYLDANAGPDLTATAHELKIRSKGGQAALFLDGDLFCGPVTIPAALASSTLHGFSTDDLAGSVAETPTISDITIASNSAALPTYSSPTIDSAAKIGTVTKYTSGSSIAVPYPATINAGDLLLCFVANESNRSFTVPAGWTSVYNGGFLLYSMACYKVATGSESGTLSVSMSGAITSGAAVMVAITNPSAYFPTQQSSTATSADGCNLVGSGTLATAPARDLIGLNRMVLLFSFTGDDVTHTHPGAFTTIAETTSGGATCRLKLSARVASTDGVSIPQGSTGTADVTLGSSTSTYLAHLVVNPKTY